MYKKKTIVLHVIVLIPILGGIVSLFISKCYNALTVLFVRRAFKNRCVYIRLDE